MLHPLELPYEFLPSTKDIWARDYMPIQTADDRFVEYRFDPDYLQGSDKGFRDLKTHPDIVCDSIGLPTKKSELILDGGNVVKSSNCVIMTDKVVNENRHSYSKKSLTERLKETFQVERLVFIPWDRSEFTGHSDGMLRFINDDSVLVNYHYKEDTKMTSRLKKVGLKVNYIEYSVRRNYKYNWAYLNFLQTEDLILLPKLGIEEDDQAFDQIEHHFSDYRGRIMQVEMGEIVKLGGALNCITWTVKT